MVTFTRTVDDLYEYFTTVGVDGKPADCLVDSSLQLTPKIHWVARLASEIFTSLACTGSRKSTNIYVVQQHWEDCLQRNSSASYTETEKRAEFITNVLRVIQKKCDKGFATLFTINKFRALLECTGNLGKARFKELFSSVEARYFAGKAIDPHDELRMVFQELTSWAKLDQNLLALIFKKLSPFELGRVMKVCKSWKAASSRIEVWDTFKNNPSYSSFRLRFPSILLSDNLLDLVKVQQQFRRAIENTANTPNRVVLLNTRSHPDSNILTSNEELTVVKEHNTNEFLVLGNDGQATRFYSLFLSFMHPILVQDRLYVAYFFDMVPGLTIYFVDRQRGSAQIFQAAHHVKFFHSNNNKAYFLLHNNTVFIYDFDQATGFTRPVAGSNNQAILTDNYVYRNNNRELVILNLSDPNSVPHVVPGSNRDWSGPVLAMTSNTIFLTQYYGYDYKICHILELDILSGEIVGDYFPGSIRNTRWSYGCNSFHKIQKVHISHNLLFVKQERSTGSYSLHIFDLFSQRHINTFQRTGLDRLSLVDFAVRGNRIYTIQHSESTNTSTKTNDSLCEQEF